MIVFKTPTLWSRYPSGPADVRLRLVELKEPVTECGRHIDPRRFPCGHAASSVSFIPLAAPNRDYHSNSFHHLVFSIY